MCNIQAIIETYFVLNLPMMLNRQDYDEELADETYILALFPYSDNPELSVSMCNFHREFSVFVLNLVVVQV